MLSDYRWLPNSWFKGINYPLPTLIEAEGNFGGYFDPTANIIAINYSYGDEYTQGTITHEMWHFIQHCMGYENEYEGATWAQLSYDYKYEDAIKLYFLSNTFEMEALLMEYKYGNNESTEWWLKKLILE